MRITNDAIYFWGSFMSNWIPHNLTIHYDNEVFTNSEQLFMYLKAKTFKDDEIAKELILRGKDPKVAKDLGRLVKNYNESIWEKLREEMMFKAVLLKFQSDPKLKKQLLETGNKELVEGTPFDPVWGVKIKWDDDRILDKRNWRGQNLLGKVLMDVRETLNNKKQ